MLIITTRHVGVVIRDAAFLHATAGQSQRVPIFVPDISTLLGTPLGFRMFNWMNSFPLPRSFASGCWWSAGIRMSTQTAKTSAGASRFATQTIQFPQSLRRCFIIEFRPAFLRTAEDGMRYSRVRVTDTFCDGVRGEIWLRKRGRLCRR